MEREKKKNKENKLDCMTFASHVKKRVFLKVWDSGRVQIISFTISLRRPIDRIDATWTQGWK